MLLPGHPPAAGTAGTVGLNTENMPFAGKFPGGGEFYNFTTTVGCDPVELDLAHHLGPGDQCEEHSAADDTFEQAVDDRQLPAVEA